MSSNVGSTTSGCLRRELASLGNVPWLDFAPFREHVFGQRPWSSTTENDHNISLRLVELRLELEAKRVVQSYLDGLTQCPANVGLARGASDVALQLFDSLDQSAPTLVPSISCPPVAASLVAQYPSPSPPNPAHIIPALMSSSFECDPTCVKQNGRGERKTKRKRKLQDPEAPPRKRAKSFTRGKKASVKLEASPTTSEDASNLKPYPPVLVPYNYDPTKDTLPDPGSGYHKSIIVPPTSSKPVALSLDTTLHKASSTQIEGYGNGNLYKHFETNLSSNPTPSFAFRASQNPPPPAYQPASMPPPCQQFWGQQMLSQPTSFHQGHPSMAYPSPAPCQYQQQLQLKQSPLISPQQMPSQVHYEGHPPIVYAPPQSPPPPIVPTHPQYYRQQFQQPSSGINIDQYHPTNKFFPSGRYPLTAYPSGHQTRWHSDNKGWKVDESEMIEDWKWLARSHHVS